MTTKLAGSMTITLTFADEARQIQFSLYDIDLKDEVRIFTDGTKAILSGEEIHISYAEKGYNDANKLDHYDPKVRVIALTSIFFCPPVQESQIGGRLYIDIDKSLDFSSLDLPIEGSRYFSGQ